MNAKYGKSDYILPVKWRSYYLKFLVELTHQNYSEHCTVRRKQEGICTFLF